MTIEIETKFDDGDALSQDVLVDGKLIGSIWMDGEGEPAYARAMSNVTGYWLKDCTKFQTMPGALRGLLFQAKPTAARYWRRWIMPRRSRGYVDGNFRYETNL